MTLEATLDATVEAGTVTFVFRVENTGDSPVGLTFSSGQTADVSVSEQGREETVWRWSADRMFTQAIRQRTLDPGEEIREELRWRDPSAGEYVARGGLAANRSVEAETVFSV